MDYQLLPFRFKRFNDTEYLLTNEVGEYIFLQNEDFHHLVNGELDIHSDLFYDIESKQIATTDKVEDVVSLHPYTWLFRLCAAIPVVSIARSHAKIETTILPI